MALKGTIRDFGVADIFQLIGQQAKTGVLVFKNDIDEVRVSFKDGAVVRADSETRPQHMLLGSMLVRAEVISQDQLDFALKDQKKAFRPVGRILTEAGHLEQDTIIEFAKLQMTETLYALFTWRSGTYEFEGIPVEPSQFGLEPMRAENIVMNGIRMTDEWPSIRERIPSYAWTVERVRALPEPKARASSTVDEFNLGSLDAGGNHSTDLDDIGAYERLIYDLVAPGRDVQKVIDLARIGEFEACRAISSLMSAGYVRVVKPSAGDEENGSFGAPFAKKVIRGLKVAGRIAVSASLVVIAAMLIGRISPSQFGLDPGGELAYSPQPVQSHLSESQMRVIRRALEVYRYENGTYPENLEVLVNRGMLTTRDTRFPYRRPYFYKVREDAIVLLPPIH